MKKIDLNKIVNESLNAAGFKKENKDINEVMVAQQKKYPQVGESVSQKTKDAHNRIYKDFIEKFNKVSIDIDSVSKDTNSNYSTYRELKVAESYNTNALWLHELYFANSFDPNSEVYADSYSYIRLQRDFGTFEDWQRHFIATSLSARQGWAVCAYNIYLNKYVCTFIDDNSSNVMMGLYPVIVIDMCDHAMYKEYLDDKNSYIISQMRELNWNVIDDRFKRAERIAEALK